MVMGGGVVTRIAELTRRLICACHGHDALLHFEHGRMSLLCASCGYESPGWEWAPTVRRPRADKPASKPRPRLVRLPMVGARRVS